jgi:phosphatidylglycerol---prolipoprotein diacylglyceryl transferase
VISSFQIGPLTIHFYGIIIMLGVLAAGFLAGKEANRHNQDGEIVWDMLIWILIGGIIGARLWHIFTPSPSLIAQGITTYFYLSHPLTILAIWNGGLGIPGAALGGVLALYIYTRKNQLSFLHWIDILAPSLALGQAIGRWGNFFNQELYGAPTHLPWAIFIDPQHRLAGFENQAYYHPTFLYESLWNLCNMVFLLWMSTRGKNLLFKGDVFLLYLILYPIGRILLEFLRLDSSQVAGLNANQSFMLVVFMLASLSLLFRHLFALKKKQIDQ